jgi:FkbM family methyltransferase
MAPRPAWLTAALEHQRAGRLAEADRLYEEILHANPSQADALHLRGLIAAAREQYESAGRLIARAIMYKPDRADFYASLGNLFLARGQGKEMAECYRQAILREPFGTIPASLDEIYAHAGHDRPVVEFPTDFPQYKSQYLQDILLDRWVFKGRTGCVFVDIGAHDGVTYSNSFFFEKVRGWRGVCIEPNPEVFAQLVANRQCATLNCCVSDRAGAAPFMKVSGYSEMLSGIVENYDPEHRLRIAQEIEQFGGSSEIVSIEARTFRDVVTQCDFPEVTYLSIDTEGSELSILQSIDFTRVFVHALTVEYNFEHAKAQLIALMGGNGFDLAQVLGHDLLFLNRASPFHPRNRRSPIG